MHQTEQGGGKGQPKPPVNPTEAKRPSEGEFEPRLNAAAKEELFPAFCTSLPCSKVSTPGSVHPRFAAGAEYLQHPWRIRGKENDDQQLSGSSRPA